MYYKMLLKGNVVCLSLTSLATIFHNKTLSGRYRELDAHFHSAASLKYHAPDT